MTEVIIPGWKKTSRTTEHFFYALYQHDTTDMGSIGAVFMDATPLEIPPGVRRRCLWMTWIIQSSFLPVLSFLLARNNSRALVTDYHPIVWCDWSSLRE